MRKMIPGLLFLMLTSLPAWSDIGQIKRLNGEVSILRGSEILPAQVGTLLEASDIIVTGPGSRVGIIFIDNTRFSAGPRSRIEIAKFVFDTTTHAGQFEARVHRGTLGVVSGEIAKQSHRPGEESMKVYTPSSVLGVRGTHFMVRVAE